MAHVQCLVVKDRRADNDRVEIVRVSLRFHQSLTSTGRATFEVGELRVRPIVGLYNSLGRIRSQMDRSISEVDSLVEIVSERRVRFGAAVMTRIGIRDGVALRQPIVGEIQQTILPTISDVQQAAIPVRSKRKLHHESYTSGYRSLNVAIFR